MSVKKSRAQCANCTCSPGLLSRNRRSSIMNRRISYQRLVSSGAVPTSLRAGSVFNIDAALLCLPEVKEINTSQRLARLRTEMAKYNQNLGVYIVPSEDQHQSEYTLAADQRRSFISGFQGSAGVAVVTRDVTCMNDTPEGLAALLTDGRYFAQATNELDFNWKLLRHGVKEDLPWEEWCVEQAVQMSLDLGLEILIGVDPTLIRGSLAEKFDKLIKDSTALSKAKVRFVGVEENLVDKIWGEFESPVPEMPANPVYLLSEQYHGRLSPLKVSDVTAELKRKNAHGLVVTALDEVAWLLNLRGSDIEYNPVFFAYATVMVDGKVNLFTDNLRLTAPVRDELARQQVQVEPYAQFWKWLKQTSAHYKTNNYKLVIPNACLWQVSRTLACSFEQCRSPIEDLKSIKNPVELAGAKLAHLKDGRALIKTFAWLEYQLNEHQELIDEVEVDNKLTEFRQQEENFQGLSFATISLTGANAAVIHYKPVKGECACVNPDKLYLNDSGSQFLEGTTDTTRTIYFGNTTTPPPEQQRNYTLVLKGNIALGSLKFPEGVSGYALDSVARQFLWAHHLDYGHGTAHGVGAFLNVHEGPINIGPRFASNPAPLKVGHLLSNEPGYYEDGKYGIRIENVMYVKETGQLYGGKAFLEFETVTRVPFCRKLIDTSLLTVTECEWINNYHQVIWDEVSPTLDAKSLEYKWLKRETQPIK